MVIPLYLGLQVLVYRGRVYRRKMMFVLKYGRIYIYYASYPLHPMCNIAINKDKWELININPKGPNLKPLT
jgi:hypothetical protein